ncbi:unnamed protein product [Vitrella brassicaformis CCMP3155]|uniref:Uncharacterized protein n=1 Tax=Vitrella brassicaformis (strain CCMP3155) TaxID=1169540 RepID=A0A0G4EGX9_VITBC|nr:unnamed protein product [Vitrella brassicaformis CCMP3155]|eukprot:CEL94624.1 unnamed protein product [Vitrella brassicaformis CCMP3155]
MAPKKKAAAKGGDEPDPLEVFLKAYRKNVKEYETPKIPEVERILAKIQEDGEPVAGWNFREEIDPMAFRVLMHTLHQTNYPGIRALRLWRCRGGDEFVRSICYYLDAIPSPNVEELQFVDTNMTPLGCDFVGRTLCRTGNAKITFLRLDFNKIGSEGAEALAKGLAENASIKHLSLQYCGITSNGGVALSQMLMYVRSALTEVLLRGNELGREGAIDVLRGARRAQRLKCLDLSDNKFGDSDDVLDNLLYLFVNHTGIEEYRLLGNSITDAGAERLLQGIVGNTHLKTIMLPERISKQTLEAISQSLGGGGKGGKKKKGGRKKK